MHELHRRLLEQTDRLEELGDIIDKLSLQIVEQMDTIRTLRDKIAKYEFSELMRIEGLSRVRNDVARWTSCHGGSHVSKDEGSTPPHSLDSF